MTTRLLSLELRLARRRARARGYNAVEILMAMTIFAIGAAGVISMQKTAIQANYDARTLDVANALTRTWQERLARDAMTWKGTGVNATTYLGGVVASTSNPAWITPVPGSVLEGTSPAFDLLGRDVPIADTNMIFCTQIRLEWLGPTSTLMRAEVRVVWPRAGARSMGNCNAAGMAAAFADANALPHVLSTVTSLRANN